MNVVQTSLINRTLEMTSNRAKQAEPQKKIAEPAKPQQDTSNINPKAVGIEELMQRTKIQMQKTEKAQNSSQTWTKMTAQHILVKDEQKAIELKQAIDACATSGEKAEKFAELAKKHSTCPSGKEGGGLGEFGKNQMVKEFEEAAANLKLGDVSEPVKTQFGWHLILVNEKK